jgi:hypothetical protein
MPGNDFANWPSAGSGIRLAICLDALNNIN